MNIKKHLFNSLAGNVVSFPSQPNTNITPADLLDAPQDILNSKEVRRLSQKMLKREIEYTIAAVNYHKAIAKQQIEIYNRLRKNNPNSAIKYMNIGKKHADLANDIQNHILIAGFKLTES